MDHEQDLRPHRRHAARGLKQRAASYRRDDRVRRPRPERGPPLAGGHRVASPSDGGGTRRTRRRRWWWIALTIAGSIVVVALGVVIGVPRMADRGATRGRCARDGRELPRGRRGSHHRRRRVRLRHIGLREHRRVGWRLAHLSRGDGVDSHDRGLWRSHDLEAARRSLRELARVPLERGLGHTSHEQRALILPPDLRHRVRVRQRHVVDAPKGHVELDQLVRQHRSHVDPNGTDRRRRTIRDRRRDTRCDSTQSGSTACRAARMAP